MGALPYMTDKSCRSIDWCFFSYINHYGLSRKHIFTSIKESLQRLDLEYVDVLQCHRFDPDTPIEETMKALHDVVQAGYARYIGMSSCYAYQFQAMQSELVCPTARIELIINV
jgi:aryl-alcohol dehydrogenase-like predicted oxidoreductase